MVTIVINLVIIIAKADCATGTARVFHAMLASLVKHADLDVQMRFRLVWSAMGKMLVLLYV